MYTISICVGDNLVGSCTP